MDFKEQTACFSGHRKVPARQQAELVLRLNNAVVKLINNGYKYFIAGGALGFDTLAAKTVLNLKTDYPDIRLILALPCQSQTFRWSLGDIEAYETIKNAADKVVYISDSYTKDCMYRRNRYLVDNSSVCICYLTEEGGGTAYTVRYANKNGLLVVNLAG